MSVINIIISRCDYRVTDPQLPEISVRGKYPYEQENKPDAQLIANAKLELLALKMKLEILLKSLKNYGVDTDIRILTELQEVIHAQLPKIDLILSKVSK